MNEKCFIDIAKIYFPEVDVDAHVLQHFVVMIEAYA